MGEHKARKRLEQNLLQDMRIIADIANAVRPQADDVVTEIGPGLAAITEPLTKKLNHLHAIEIGHDIVGRLKTLPFVDRLVIHEDGVLQFDLNGITDKKRIVGSLLYNIPTPLLFRLAEVADDVVETHFMLQERVVERMMAAPKSNDYSRLDVILQYFFDMELLIDVSPEPFDPAPKIGSAVVRMIPMKHRIGRADNFEHFVKLVKFISHQRCRTIHNNLGEFAGDGDLQVVSISPRDHAGRIMPGKYVELNNYLVRKAV